MYNFLQFPKKAVKIPAWINFDPALAKAASINPRLALDELGLELELEARLALEDRARFNKSKIAERARLRKKIFGEAGEPFDPADGKALEAILHDRLDLAVDLKERPDVTPVVPASRAVAAKAPPRKLKKGPARESDAGRQDETPPVGMITNPRFDRADPTLVEADVSEESRVTSATETRRRLNLSSAEWAKFDAGMRAALAREAGAAAAPARVMILLERTDADAAADATRPKPGVKELQASFREAARPLLTTMHQAGAQDITELWLVGGVATTLRLEAAAELARIPQVRSIALVTRQNALPEN